MARGRLIDRVVLRVYESVQKAQSQEDYELGSITLRLLGLVRAGEKATMDLATYAAFGCAFSVWRGRNMERQAQLAWAVQTLIPDYDPTMEPSGSIRGPAAGGRPVYEMPPKAGSPQQKPVLPMPPSRTGT